MTKNEKWEEYLLLSHKKRVIAEFMGVEVQQAYPPNEDLLQDGLLYYFGPRSIKPHNLLYKYHSTSGMAYDTDWNWIMPVIRNLRRYNRVGGINPKSVLRDDKKTLFEQAYELITHITK